MPNYLEAQTLNFALEKKKKNNSWKQIAIIHPTKDEKN